MKTRCWMLPSFEPQARMLRVALPVCERDYWLMMNSLDWQEELDGRKDFDCVLSLDGGMSAEHRRDLEIAAWRTYASVETLLYPPPPVEAWPQAPNWAFQHTARYMQPGGRPWFWMEPDCVPLKPEWLYKLNQEYCVCRKPIMGVIVKGMGHCNGTAIYPANFPALSRAAMNCTDIAWDGLMKDETIKLTHDASRLICHVWGIKHQRAQPFGGDPAHFSCWSDVRRWVDLNAVVFHRAKDTSLIERLREMRRGLILS